MEHPVHQIKSELVSRYPGVSLEFSKYVYKEYGVTESREVFHATGDKIGERWLEDQVEQLNGEQELAMHSKIIWKSVVFHIPMIDFINIHTFEDIAPRIETVNEFLEENISVYNSGNSFHGYYFCLINDKRWHEFLGKCLLSNSPRVSPSQIIDPRWIGHSLEHGFSALRWSKNTNRHRSIPYLIHAKESAKGRVEEVVR